MRVHFEIIPGRIGKFGAAAATVSKDTSVSTDTSVINQEEDMNVRKY